MKYDIYWKFGEYKVSEGESVEKAFTNSGYGAGAISAVDFYDTGEEIKGFEAEQSLLRDKSVLKSLVM